MFSLNLDDIEYPSKFNEVSINNIALFNKYRVYTNNGIVKEYGGMFIDVDNPNKYKVLLENNTDMYTRNVNTSSFSIISTINNYNDVGIYTETTVLNDFYGFISGQTIEPLDLTKFDKCSSIKGWLARTTSTQNYNVTLYFNVESSKQLQEVIDYYKLTTPSSKVLDELIDTNRFAIRFKTFKLGGEFISLVPASITFDMFGKAIDANLYITTRQEDEYLLETVLDTSYNRGIVTDTLELVLNKPCYDRSLFSYNLVPTFPTFRPEKYYDGIIYKSSVFDEPVASMSPNDPIHARQLQSITSKDIYLLDSGIKLTKLLYDSKTLDAVNRDNFDKAKLVLSSIVGQDIEPDYFATFVDDSLNLFEPTQHKVQLYFKCDDLSKFNLSDLLNKDSNLVSVIIDTIANTVISSVLHYTHTMLRKV